MRSSNEITRWVRKNTTDRFGPVRAVRPEHVFEIAFEGIQKSTRHKSGVALRFPPHGPLAAATKPLAEANTLDDLKADAGPVAAEPASNNDQPASGRKSAMEAGAPDFDAQPVEVATWVLRVFAGLICVICIPRFPV